MMTKEQMLITKKNKTTFMKSLIKLSLAIIVGALLFTSCSKTNDSGKMIPKNAMFIVHLDTKSLLGKLSYDEIKQTSWFKKLSSDTSVPGFAKTLLDKPENSGIDIKEGFVFFGAKSAIQGQMVLEGGVKDAKQFEAFNKNFNAGASATKDGDINMMTLNEKVVVGWNNSKFVYVIDAPMFVTNIGSMMNDSTGTKTAPMGASIQNLSMACKNLFSLKTDSSMGKDEKFSELLKENGDIHIWQNTEEMVKNSGALGMLGMLKLDAFISGNIATYTLSFDDGQITAKQKWYTSKELSDILKKYNGSSINSDMIKNIPSQDITGLFALNFKPEGFKEMIKLTGMDGMINMFTAQQGFTLDDFVNANKGDILFSVSDLKIETPVNDTSNGMGAYPKPSATYLFATGINDKAAFDKLIAAGKKVSAGKNEGVFYANTDKLFAIGNKQDAVTKYVAGGSSKFDFLDKLKDHPLAFYIDLQKIFTVIPASKMDSTEKIVLSESQKIWNKIYSAGGEFKDGGMVSKTEVTLMDKATNSLKQLNKYFDAIAPVMIAKHERLKAELKNNFDTTMVVAPPVMDTARSKTK
jgi:hypothetical protein